MWGGGGCHGPAIRNVRNDSYIGWMDPVDRGTERPGNRKHGTVLVKDHQILKIDRSCPRSGYGGDIVQRTVCLDYRHHIMNPSSVTAFHAPAPLLSTYNLFYYKLNMAVGTDILRQNCVYFSIRIQFTIYYLFY